MQKAFLQAVGRVRDYAEIICGAKPLCRRAGYMQGSTSVIKTEKSPLVEFFVNFYSKNPQFLELRFQNKGKISNSRHMVSHPG